MVMGILLGLIAALMYGSSDFGGGLASRRYGSLPVTVIGAAVSTMLAWAALLSFGGPGPSLRAVAWGLASGLASGAGTLLLYRGLARGQMSVVGPLSAVGAVVVPVVAGIALGERPSLLTVAGVVVALPAVVLVAASGSARGKLGADPKSLFDGLAAGVAYGILFIGLAQAGHHAGLWPVACEQTGTLLLTLGVAVKSRQPLRIPFRAAGVPVLVGTSGMAGTMAYFYATHFSMLAIAAVLVSLYPGVTVLLARALLHERFTPAQRAGLGLASLAIIAIALN
jgi:drug/metabolite transporter (DMT)-like permease